MASFHDLTTAQLKQAVQIREQIESLQAKLDALLGGAASTKAGRATGKRTLSAATKRKMAAAQQARWAKVKGPATSAKAPKTVAEKKGGITAAGRAKLAAAMKARWAAKKKASESGGSTK